MPRYHDAPLPKDHIRLFKFVHPSDNITLVTKTFNFYRAPKYKCISYCWGLRSDGAATITCDNTPLEVWDNLHAALRRFWRETANDHKNESWFWNDAISIEQGDDDVALTEKAGQIASMETIFLLSDPVLVWLGDADEDEERAFLTLADICEKLAGKRASKDSTAGLPDASDPIWRLWSQVMLRPWFARLWIVQECIFIKGKVIVTLGSRAQTSWSNFHEMVRRAGNVPWTAAELLQYDKLDARAKRTVDRDFELEWGITLDSYDDRKRGRSRDDALRSCIYRNTVNIRELMHLERYNDQDFGYFQQVLKVFGNRKCTYNQDRPNAMRGLLDDRLKKGLKVYDIHADVASVYREVSRVWLTNDPMLALLQRIRPLAKFMPVSHVNSATKLKNPSWALDLARVVTEALGDGIPYRIDGFHAGLVMNTTLLGKSEWVVPEAKSSLFSRHKNVKHVTFVDDNECHVAGVEIGVVQQVVSSSSHYNGQGAAQGDVSKRDKALLEWLDETFMLVKNIIADARSAAEVHWRTLVLNHTYMPDPDVKTMFDIDDIHSRQREYDRTMEILRSDDHKALLEQAGDPTQTFHSNATQFRFDFPNWFSISTGHVGRALAVPKSGDVLAVLYGAATPFLLRPVEGQGKYEFMGEAYAHGVMQGEALLEKYKDRFPKRVFVLI